MSTVVTLGPVGFKPTGAYNNSIEYKKLDVVLYQGSSYVAIMDTIGNVPTNDSYWYLLAKGGIDIMYDTTIKSLNIAIQGTITYNSLVKSLNFQTA